ncbi:MAG: hypothetical protein BGO51_14350 [Rhodospirillales bacterium 69-11]|nr:MAG: hypothetical protein BGO51_14350 [Rhodospirillales bacterium 69-11]
MLCGKASIHSKPDPHLLSTLREVNQHDSGEEVILLTADLLDAEDFDPLLPSSGLSFESFLEITNIDLIGFRLPGWKSSNLSQSPPLNLGSPQEGNTEIFRTSRYCIIGNYCGLLSRFD